MKKLKANKLRFFTTDSGLYKPINPKSPLVYLSVEKRIETSKVLADLGISEGFKLAGIIQHGLSKADKGKINVEDILF